MKALLGLKIGMSQMFSPQGEVVPVTLIQAYPNQVHLRRTAQKDGYTAVQLALPKKNINHEESDEQTSTPEKYVTRREFKGEMADDVTVLTVEQFTAGDVVEVSGISKGKGFQGVVKRHNFKGGPASHGHTDWERKGGSIGQRFPQHTIKGKKMAGRMGADRVTVKNLIVMAIDMEKHMVAVKGAVPGRYGTILELRESKKEVK